MNIFDILWWMWKQALARQRDADAARKQEEDRIRNGKATQDRKEQQMRAKIASETERVF